MPKPFHPTDWLRRHPLTALLFVATVIVDVALERDPDPFGLIAWDWWSCLWSGLYVSQLTLLVWWIAPASRGWDARFCAALVGGSILVYQFDIYQGPMWSIWHSAIVFFSVWVIRRSTFPGRGPRNIRIRFNLKNAFLLTTIVAAGFGAHSYGTNNRFDWLVGLNITSRDGQIISGIVLGVMIPSLYFRRLPRDLVRWITLFLTFAVTGICIVLGAYSWDPCVYFETIREVIPFNLAQASIFIIWLTALRIESDWREHDFAYPPQP